MADENSTPARPAHGNTVVSPPRTTAPEHPSCPGMGDWNGRSPDFRVVAGLPPSRPLKARSVASGRRLNGYSCGGSRGFGRQVGLTVFPFHPPRGGTSSGRETSRHPRWRQSRKPACPNNFESAAVSPQKTAKPDRILSAGFDNETRTAWMPFQFHAPALFSSRNSPRRRPC